MVDWKVWDVASGRVTASVAFPEGDGEWAVLNTDGSRLAIALKTDDDESGRHEHLLMVVETATGRRVVRQTLNNNLYHVEFSPDGRKLAGLVSPHEAEGKIRPRECTRSSGTRRRGPRSGAIPGTFPRGGRGLRSVPTANAWPPQSRRAATRPRGTSRSGRLEFRSRSRLVSDGRPRSTVTTLGFSPDGKALAAVAVYPAGDVLHVWDVATVAIAIFHPAQVPGPADAGRPSAPTAAGSPAS